MMDTDTVFNSKVTIAKKPKKEANKGEDPNNEGEDPNNEDKKPRPPKTNIGSIGISLLKFLERKKPSYRADDMPRHDERYKPWNIWFKRELSGSIRIFKIEEFLPKCFNVTELLFSQLIAEINNHTMMFAGTDVPWMKYCLTNSQAKDLAEKMMGIGRDVSELEIKFEPKICGFKSEKGYIFYRTDFDPNYKATVKDFPFLHEYFIRIVNYEALCNRIVSIFDANADRKQFVVLYGPGDGGKSSIFDVLIGLGGGKSGTAPVDEHVFENKFGLWNLLNKRVWIASELNPDYYNGVKSSLIKRLTGGDLVSIEGKNEKPFAATLDGLLFINSNDAPVVPRDSGILNRILIFNVPAIPEDQKLDKSIVKENIDRELKHFLGYWAARYNPGRTLLKDSSEIDSSVSDYEAPMEELFDSLFKEDLTCQGKCDRTLKSSEFQKIWRKLAEDHPAVVSRIKVRAFERYISRRTGRDGLPFSKKVTNNGVRDRYVLGVRKK